MGETRAVSLYRDVLHKPVLDGDGRRAGTVGDVAASTADQPLRITTVAILGRAGAPCACLPWEAVAALEARCLRLRGPAAAPEAAPPSGELLWLGRHLMDRQVVDRDGVRLLRVNDVALEREAGGGLTVLGLAGGLRGLLTRLGSRRRLVRLLALLRVRVRDDLIPWAQVDSRDPRRGTLQLSVSRAALTAERPVPSLR